MEKEKEEEKEKTITKVGQFALTAHAMARECSVAAAAATATLLPQKLLTSQPKSLTKPSNQPKRESESTPNTQNVPIVPL